MVAESASTANDTTPSRFQPTWLALLGFGLATRLIVVVLGCFLALPESSVKSRVVHSPHNDGMNPRHLAALSSGSRRWIEPWYRWDAMWYLDISQRGYSYRPGSESSVAFMPLLPLLIKIGVTVGFDPYWSGLLIPNLAFVAGLALFGRGVLRVTESAATTWRACILLVAFPSSFYFSAPYQESLGLALTAAALLAWLNHRPAQSAAAPAGVGRATDGVVDVGRARPGMGARPDQGAARPSFGVVGRNRGHPRDGALLRLPHPAISRSAPAPQGPRRLAAKDAQRPSASGSDLVVGPRFDGHAPEVGGLHSFADAATRLAVPQAITFGLSSSRGAAVPSSGRSTWTQEGPKPSPAALAGWIVASGAVLLISIGLLVLRARGSTVDVLSTLHMVAYSRDLLVTILFLGLGIHAFLKRGPLWGCVVLVPVLQALASGSILSMTRVVLSSYPGFLDAAEIASNRAVFAITVVVFLFAQFVLLTSYVNWIFVA